MLPTLVPEPFDSPDHLFELKWGGVRALAYVQRAHLRLQARNLRDLSPLYPELAGLPSQLRARSALLDGEIVALGPEGYPDFGLQRSRLASCLLKPSAKRPAAAEISYQAFDVLFLDGRSLLNRPLAERKSILRDVLEPSQTTQVCDFIEDEGIAFFEAAVEHKLEGIVAKEKSSLYFPARRSSAWLEVRALQGSEFVIGGYTFGGGRRRDPFQGLLLGAYRGGRLHYVGQVSGGYSEEEAAGLVDLLSKMHVARCPFVEPPAIQRFIFWVKPQVVCQVRFSHWSPQGRLRFPVFAGLRTDVSPQDCFAEQAPPPPPRPRRGPLS